MNNAAVDKILTIVNRKFAPYPKTKEVLDLKEEMISIMIDKYNDLDDSLTEKQKVASCLEVMGAYKEILSDLETVTVRKIMKTKLIDYSIFTSIYFFITIMIYLIYSLLIHKSFNSTYVIVIGMGIIYIFISSIFIYRYFKKMMFEKMQRASLSFIYGSAIAFLYVLPNLYLNIFHQINVWHPSWIICILIGNLYAIHDAFKYQKQMSKPIRILRRGINTFLLTTIIYLLISLEFKCWNITWLIYVAWFFITEIEIIINYRAYLKKMNERDKDE